MINYCPHDRMVEERDILLRKLAYYEHMKMVVAWNDAWYRIAELNRILEVNP